MPTGLRKKYGILNDYVRQEWKRLDKKNKSGWCVIRNIKVVIYTEKVYINPMCHIVNIIS
jgi:hypothetical protein